MILNGRRSQMQYHFRFVSGRHFTLEASPSSTIISVKHLIHNQFPEVDSSTVKLVHRSQVLPDSALLSSTGVTSADFIVVQHRSFRMRPTGFPSCPIAPGLPVHAESSLQELLNMGFTLSRARIALTSTHGNVPRAVDLLVREASIDLLPSGMPRKWAERIAREPNYLENLIRQLITEGNEVTAERFRNDPAAFVRDAGLNPADFDIEGIRQRVAGLRGTAINPSPAIGTELVTRLAEEFPGFGTSIIIDILLSAEINEDAARAQLKKMMAP
jgi:hypothetical protein